MVRLVLESLGSHLASLYKLSCSHHLVDTVLVCRDGKLYQNRLVVQMMLKLLDLNDMSDSDMVIIMPEYSVQEVQLRIQQMFGMRSEGQDDLAVEESQDLDPVTALVCGSYPTMDSYDSYGIPELLAKLTSTEQNIENQSELNSVLAGSGSIDIGYDSQTRQIQTPDFIENMSAEVIKTTDKSALKENKKKSKVKQKDVHGKVGKVRDMTKPFKPVKMVYKDRPKNLTCPQCPYKTYHISNLTNHMRTHTGEKPFSCQHCGESFRFSGVRNLHEKTHTGEKEYSCQYCGKEFARRYVCILHERTHTGEKPFACDYCGKRFTRHSTKVNHEKSHVGDPGCSFAGIVGESQETDVYVDLV